MQTIRKFDLLSFQLNTEKTLATIGESGSPSFFQSSKVTNVFVIVEFLKYLRNYQTTCTKFETSSTTETNQTNNNIGSNNSNSKCCNQNRTIGKKSFLFFYQFKILFNGTFNYFGFDYFNIKWMFEMQQTSFTTGQISYGKTLFGMYFSM